jgi:hypothetical protein
MFKKFNHNPTSSEIVSLFEESLKAIHSYIVEIDERYRTLKDEVKTLVASQGAVLDQ